jgi:hypothetical protein
MNDDALSGQAASRAKMPRLQPASAPDVPTLEQLDLVRLAVDLDDPDGLAGASPAVAPLVARSEVAAPVDGDVPVVIGLHGKAVLLGGPAANER